MFVLPHMHGLLWTMRRVVPLPLSDISREGIEKLTLQVYCPPSDVFSRGNERILLLETRSPDEFSHSTDGGVTRLRGAVKLHSVEKGLPASDTILPLVTFGARGSGEQKILCKVE